MTYGVFDLFFKSGVDRVNIGQLIHDYDGGITNIERNIGGSRSNTYGDGYGRFGEKYVTGRLGSKKIKVEFVVNLSIYEAVDFRRKMAEALDCPNGLERLVFGDDPNYYYEAIPEGDISLKETIGDETGTGSITFVVPDGLAHSVTASVIKPNTESDLGSIVYNSADKMATVTINNKSNVEVYPKITFKNNSENGYYGIAHPNGLMEIGSKEATEEGEAEYKGGTIKAETLLNIKKGNNSDDKGWGLFKDASDTFSESPISSNVVIQGGGIKYYNGPMGGKYFTKTSGLGWNKKGSNVGGYKWTGGISQFKLPADSAGEEGAVNFRADFNIKVWESKMGQTGYLSIGFLDKDNDLICAYDIAKIDTKGDEALAKFEGPKGAQPALAMKKFGANNNEKKQKKPNTAFNSKKGQAYIIKEGSRLTFGYGGKPYSYNVKEIAESKVYSIIITSGKYIKQGKAGFFSQLNVESIRFQKLGVKKYEMVDNRYTDGSRVEVDLFNGKIGIAEDDEQDVVDIQNELVLGSEFFSIPKGTSTMEVYFSDWCEQLPDIEVTLNESKL